MIDMNNLPQTVQRKGLGIRLIPPRKAGDGWTAQVSTKAGRLYYINYQPSDEAPTLDEVIETFRKDRKHLPEAGRL